MFNFCIEKRKHYEIMHICDTLFFTVQRLFIHMYRNLKIKTVLYVVFKLPGDTFIKDIWMKKIIVTVCHLGGIHERCRLSLNIFS